MFLLYTVIFLNILGIFFICLDYQQKENDDNVSKLGYELCLVSVPILFEFLWLLIAASSWI
ncbi:hypothetical protein [Enterococcus dispar]|uniref:hypothetical protein n=1 Tax=Enterococcus dispar TaxID=44009 RepID=UPI002890A1D9|nr:hypothetical protein [Enterococcus dispar]MDT2704814.1 hypothetical protein [Enterococcus dispar]